MPKTGRPSIYTPELADKICAELAQGVSMRTICLRDEMPARETIFKWLREKPEFSDQYAKAKEESSDALVEDMLDIADDGSNDYMVKRLKAIEDKPEDERTEDDWRFLAVSSRPEIVQRSRLRVDVRKWAASKLKPKKYGDRTIHAGDPDQPIAVMPFEFVKPENTE